MSLVTFYLPINCSLLCSLLCSVTLGRGSGGGVPCRLRPHHTSNLQNPFFPFNVGKECGKGQRAGEGSILRVGLSILGMRGQDGDCSCLPHPSLGLCPGCVLSIVSHSFLPGPQTSTEPGCLRCRCRSWTLCSSFFWWPARVMPRAGRSLVGKEWVKSELASLRSQARPWPRAQRLPHPPLPAYSRLS